MCALPLSSEMHCVERLSSMHVKEAVNLLRPTASSHSRCKYIWLLPARCLQ